MANCLINTKRILLCERALDGHRMKYLQTLLQISNLVFYVFAPDNPGVPAERFVCYLPKNLRSVEAYYDWTKTIRQLTKDWHISTVHILDGDSIMRFWGIGLKVPHNGQMLITYHHFFSGMLRRISYLLMNRSRKTISIAHTASVQKSLQAQGIRNVVRCEYPAFSYEQLKSMSQAECKAGFVLPIDRPTIGIIGGLSKYKNIIPFLLTMRRCTQDCHILIAGRPSDITEKDIIEAVQPYKEKVTLELRSLTEQEYIEAICACDIVYCLYGKDFDGASGPMIDGVCAGKLILACNHGSLGETVEQNMLGITANCESKEDVLSAVELSLARVRAFKYGTLAAQYRNSLQPDYFRHKYYQLYTQVEKEEDS